MNECSLNRGKFACLIEDCKLFWLDEAGSTNEVARSLVQSGLHLPIVTVAKRQTAGKGQQGKSWWSSDGCLTFSLAVQKPKQLEPGLIPLFSANVVADCIEHSCDDVRPRIKWPNDILLDQKKVCGILVETVSVNDSEFCIIGIGLNVNCSFQNAEKQSGFVATSLYDRIGSLTDENGLAANIVNQIVKHVATISSVEVLAQFLLRSHVPVGDEIEVEERNGNCLTGRFFGLDRDGGLIINVNGQTRKVVSASIVSRSE